MQAVHGKESWTEMWLFQHISNSLVCMLAMPIVSGVLNMATYFFPSASMVNLSFSATLVKSVSLSKY